MRDAAPAQLPDAWWCATTAATQAAVDSGPGGLAAENARDRLARFGPNRFVDRPARALWLDYLAHFRNPLVLVLLGAAAIAAATGEPIGALIVIALVVASVTLDFVQEQRASRAAEDLRATVAVHARVRARRPRARRPGGRGGAGRRGAARGRRPRPRRRPGARGARLLRQPGAA